MRAAVILLSFTFYLGMFHYSLYHCGHIAFFCFKDTKIPYQILPLFKKAKSISLYLWIKEVIFHRLKNHRVFSRSNEHLQFFSLHQKPSFNCKSNFDIKKTLPPPYVERISIVTTFKFYWGYFYKIRLSPQEV